MKNSSFSTRLQIVREENGMSQIKFGEILDNTSRHTILNYESEKRVPDLKFIIKLCQTFGINSDWLIFGNPPKYREGSKVSAKESAGELLERSLKALEVTEPKKMKLSQYVGMDIDEITADTPDNYLRLILDMKKNPRFREQIFMFHFCENREE